MEIQAEIWRMLYPYQINLLSNLAANSFWDGVENLGLDSDNKPTREHLHKRIFQKIGWSVSFVEQKLSREEFYQLLAIRVFPVYKNIRPKEQIFWSENPDFWHDVIGHLPLLVQPGVSQFYELIAKAYNRGDLDLKIKLDRLFWFTAEFGFIASENGPQIFGAGILPSPTVCHKIKQNLHQLREFEIQTVVSTPYDPDEEQTLFFVFKSVGDLLNQTRTWLSREYHAV